MSKFSIKDTAFSGYRLLAARPATALVWFVFYLIVVMVSTAAAVSLAGPQIMALREMQAAGSVDPTTAGTLTAQLVPFYLFSLIFPLAAGAIATAAITRAVLRPSQSGLGYLRFGADEVRVFVVNLVLALLFIVVYLIAFAMGLVALFASAGPQTAAAALQGQGDLPAQAIAVTALAALPGAALFLFLGVRLSLAAPQTVGEQAIRIFGSWGLTRGVFWRTFAAYLLAAIPVVVVGLAVVGVSLGLTADGTASGWRRIMEPDISSMAAVFSGSRIVIYVLQAALQTLFMAALIVPAATIYAAVATPVVDDADDDED